MLATVLDAEWDGVQEGTIARPPPAAPQVTSLYVRPVEAQSEEALLECDGSRRRPYRSIPEALAAAPANSEILLLEGHYPTLDVRAAPRNVTIRPAPGADVVFSGAYGRRGRTGRLSWRSGVPRAPLMSIDNAPMLTLADLHFEYALVGLRVTNSPDFQVLSSPSPHSPPCSPSSRPPILCLKHPCLRAVRLCRVVHNVCACVRACVSVSACVPRLQFQIMLELQDSTFLQLLHPLQTMS